MLNMYANEGKHVNEDPLVASTVMPLKLSMSSSTLATVKQSRLITTHACFQNNKHSFKQIVIPTLSNKL